MVTQAFATSSPMKLLPTLRAAQLAPLEPGKQSWLIEGLWSAQAVGIIGGEPKCGCFCRGGNCIYSKLVVPNAMIFLLDEIGKEEKASSCCRPWVAFRYQSTAKL